MTPIYSIGMGKRTLDELFECLKSENIQYLIDIRSAPYSKFRPEYNKASLQQACENNNVQYSHLPDLGGFPESEYVLTQGKVDYSKLARTSAFQQALHRLALGAESEHRIVLLCSEGRPEECHRSKCIGVELQKIKIGMLHFDIDNTIADQQQVMSRIQSDQICLPGMEKPLTSRRKWGKDFDEND